MKKQFGGVLSLLLVGVMCCGGMLFVINQAHEGVETPAMMAALQSVLEWLFAEAFFATAMWLAYGLALFFFRAQMKPILGMEDGQPTEGSRRGPSGRHSKSKDEEGR